MKTRKKYSILYVDDEPNNLNVFRSSFFKKYTLYTATSGREGIKIMEEQQIHLVITDQVMPEMTGLEFLESIKDLQPDTPRMILSGYSDVSDILKAVNEYNIFQYTTKPWNRHNLQMIIQNAIQQWQLKQDNADLIRNLEQKVHERTQSLEKANQELRDAHAVKDKLFSIISHDLRSPLATLSNFVSLLIELDDSFTPAEIRDLGKRIQTSVLRVKDLLNNLLYWSRNQMNDSHAEIQKINLTQIITRNISLFEPTAEQKNIQLQTQSPPETLMVFADNNMLDTVLRNLISNAIKFTKHDGQVYIFTKVIDNQVITEIKDSGVGMSEQVMAGLFESGRHHTTHGTAHEKGTGLGLKLCKEFIELQHGTIWVESQEGKGSTFGFKLPLA